MTLMKFTTKLGVIAALAATLVLNTGCQNNAQSGALAGGGIGALAGQAIGGDTESTLIGAAVGTGIGYIIGNEQDKEQAATMSRGRSNASSSSQTYTYSHSETGQLANTRWLLVNLAPRNFVPAYQSKVIEFRNDGRVITTTTNADGTVDVFNERYRVVGNTLIVNKPGYIINAEFRMTAGNEMVVSADDFRAVLRRIEG